MGNTETVLDFIDAWNTMDWDKASDLLDDDVVGTTSLWRK